MQQTLMQTNRIEPLNGGLTFLKGQVAEILRVLESVKQGGGTPKKSQKNLRSWSPRWNIKKENGPKCGNKVRRPRTCLDCRVRIGGGNAAWCSEVVGRRRHWIRRAAQGVEVGIGQSNGDSRYNQGLTGRGARAMRSSKSAHHLLGSPAITFAQIHPAHLSPTFGCPLRVFGKPRSQLLADPTN